MGNDQPHRQDHVEYVVLDVLEWGGIMATQQIYAAVKRKLDLAPADLEKANERDNEHKIDQIIANALQEGRNLCRKGWIERVARGEFRITQAGKMQLRELNQMKTMLDDLMPDDE